MAAKQKEEVVDSSEDEADSFDNYGVFQSDYEFKFVQEGNDKTTLMLPPVTYDSMEVKYFNVEIEVDSELLVSALEKEKTVNGTTRFFFRIAKSGGQLGQGDDGEAYEKLGEDGYDYGEMKDKAEVQAKKPKGKNPKARAPMDAHNYSKQKVMVKSAPTIKVESEELPTMNLDGTQLDDEEEEEEEDEGEDVEDDGDDDDDMDDLEEIEMLGDASLAEDDQTGSPRTPKRKKPKQEPTSSGKKRRKYDKTNYYSKESTNFSVEMTDEGKTKFICRHCGKICNTAGNMRDHLVIHIDKRTFACDECPAWFKSMKALQRHSVRHTVKTVKCGTCSALFYTTSECKSHASVHMDDRKYICDICNLAFNHSTSLSRHKKVHASRGDRQQFLCHLCTAVFYRKDNIRRHLKSIHGSDEVPEPRKQNADKWIRNKRIQTRGRTTKFWSDPHDVAQKGFDKLEDDQSKGKSSVSKGRRSLTRCKINNTLDSTE
ncbi:zinc finger and BTB domain-containing protein 17-like isoform X2 [Ruditapes philippinarum]|uniref:zinc finger and BTB domain-containing protein 17-like isoform X2 n=1 Tax=Ruditapes philippinarum TaxID=129788 RepID=UPI00295B739E|nr:zinc finger and BTB domain-containing protein 17-like isoform X2 [Ruditapes philippinarum]